MPTFAHCTSRTGAFTAGQGGTAARRFERYGSAAAATVATDLLLLCKFDRESLARDLAVKILLASAYGPC